MSESIIEISKPVLEEDFVIKLITYLQKYFRVQEQVWSKCGNGRIDIVLTHQSNIYFGIECKRIDSKKGEEIGEWLKQAIRYSKYEFEVMPNLYERIPILIYPPLSYKYLLLNEREAILSEHKTFGVKNRWHQDRHEENDSHHTINGLLGAFAIGEIRKYEDKYQKYLYFSHANKPIWSSRTVYDEWDREKNKPIESSARMVGLDNRWYESWIKKIKAL